MKPAVDHRALWREYRRTRSREVRDRLVEHHVVLVKYVAARVAGRLPSHLQMDDLYSAGLLGFLGAIEDYDPDLGVEFSIYAEPRIRGAIFDELRRLDWVPRGVRRRIRDAERAIDLLTTRLGRQPTEEEMAVELKITLAAYRELLGAGVTVISLDAPASGDEEGPAPIDGLEDHLSPSPFQTLAAKEGRQRLARLIDELPERERQVLALYYYEELTMREVGEVLGVTESRVSQLHSGAILRLRTAIRRHRLEMGEPVAAGARSGSGAKTSAPRPRGTAR
jgi:RNA polymerase sigma factor for flagellar operon FliA